MVSSQVVLRSAESAVSERRAVSAANGAVHAGEIEDLGVSGIEARVVAEIIFSHEKLGGTGETVSER